MNDFLLHLAARSFDWSEGIERVKPRLPSFFEPIPATPIDITSALTDDLSGGTPENVQVGGTLSTNPIPPSPRDPNPAKVEDPQKRFDGLPKDIEAQPFPAAGVAAGATDRKTFLNGHSIVQKQLAVETRSHDPNKSELKASERLIAPFPRGSEPGQRWGGLENPLHVPADISLKADKGGQAVAGGNQPEDKQVQQTPRPAVGKPVMDEKVPLVERVQQTIEGRLPSEKTRRESRIPIVGGISIQPIVPVIGRGGETGFQKQDLKAEPVIHVTIGRVEVRATVSSQKQTPRSVNRSPVMGLDEYLRRRSGGRDS